MLEIYFSITNVIRWIAVVLIFVFDIGIAILVVKSMLMLRKEHRKILAVGKESAGQPEQDVVDYTSEWEFIKRQAQSMHQSEWKLAVIEGDKLVDEVLKSKGYIGESMGERLMGINPSGFVSLQEAWDAHKLRNTVVHDMTQVISKGQAVGAIESYERFLTELGFFT
jgi:hypothetical protein